MDKSAVLYTAVGRLVTICEKLHDCNVVQLNTGAGSSRSNDSDSVQDIPRPIQYNIKVTGPCDCSRAMKNLTEVFSDVSPIVSWSVANLWDESRSRSFLGDHMITVECCVFSTPVYWKTRSGAQRIVKCVIKCNTNLTPNWHFVEFEDLFGGRSDAQVKDKMVVFYESVNLKIDIT